MLIALILAAAIPVSAPYKDNCTAFMFYNIPDRFVRPLLAESGREYFTYEETIPPKRKFKATCIYGEEGNIRGYTTDEINGKTNK